MARGFGRRQRSALNIVTQLTLRGLGSLLYMTKGKPSSALIQLILQLWLTQLSHLLRELQPTTTTTRLGSASKWPHELPGQETCPECGCLTAVARGCSASWHWAGRRPPGKFERAARDLDAEPLMLLNTRTYDELVRFVGDPLTRYVASIPDVSSDSFYDHWFKQGQEIKGKYRWMYDD